MKMKSSSKNMFLICCILIMILCTLSMAGCSSKSSIAGIWAKEEELESDDYSGVYDMTFYEDGSCHNLPLRTLTSAEAESYKVQEDGVLVITMEWDGKFRFESTDDPDEALNDDDYYYLSGDTLIFNQDTYVRKDT